MNIVQDIISTNKNIVHKSIKATIKNWKIFLVGIVYAFASLVMWRIAANAWILAGIITAIFQGTIISNYLYLIENIIKYERFTMDDFKSGFTIYLRKVYTIIIVFWFVRWGISIFLRPIFFIQIGPVSLWFLIQFIAFILLNPLPETIYQKHYDGVNSLTYSFDFIKENWIEWFIPNGLIFIIGYLVHALINQFIAIIFVTGLSPIISLIIRFGIYSIIYQLVLSFAMIYRGFLFDILSTSTRRKRMFMRNMYK